MVNDDNWNMSVDILNDVYDRQTQGFRAAVDKEGNVLSNILPSANEITGRLCFQSCLSVIPIPSIGVPCDHCP